MNVALIMLRRDGTRRAFAFQKARVVVGRTYHCDLRIPMASVSRKHCAFVTRDNEVLLRDLGSTNGTYVNGARIAEVSLCSGDKIAIGPVQFRLEIEELIVAETDTTTDAA